MNPRPQPTTLSWRKSSYSGSNGGSCVEVADAGDAVLVRNSKRPDEGTIAFAPAELAAWVYGCKAGEFDDLI
ncbi:MAG: DUF397 domain-containing protein [Actinomycetota bacterium]